MKKKYFYFLTIFLMFLAFFFIFGFDRYKVSGQIDLTNSSSSSGCPQIATDCLGQPEGCKFKFGIYDPETCMCICPDLIDCSINNDCPKGTCSNGKTYERFTCLENKCHEINYFADPCLFGGKDVSINFGFSGAWRGRINQCREISKTSKNEEETNPSDCVICPQVLIECPKGTKLFQQTCSMCAECIKCINPITLRLCVKEKEITGNVNIPLLLENIEIKSFSIISKNEISLILNTEKSSFSTLNLKLLNTKRIKAEFSNGLKFIARKPGVLKGCPKPECKKPCGELCCKENEKCFVDDPCMGDPACTSIPGFSCVPSSSSSGQLCLVPVCTTPPEGCHYETETIDGCPNPCAKTICSSSGGTKDCSSKGSCLSSDGEELPCPEGTSCSGLPAYGCFPPDCPVPICLSPDTKIRTDGEQKRIADIKVGDIVLTDNKKPVKVIKVNKVEVKNHKILKVLLNDATILEVSPNHPTADGRLFKDLKLGDVIDKRIVVENTPITYQYKYTHDILPDSETGNYYANGVLVGSTLKNN